MFSPQLDCWMFWGMLFLGKWRRHEILHTHTHFMHTNILSKVNAYFCGEKMLWVTLRRVGEVCPTRQLWECSRRTSEGAAPGGMGGGATKQTRTFLEDEKEEVLYKATQIPFRIIQTFFLRGESGMARQRDDRMKSSPGCREENRLFVDTAAQ